MERGKGLARRVRAIVWRRYRCIASVTHKRILAASAFAANNSRSLPVTQPRVLYEIFDSLLVRKYKMSSALIRLCIRLACAELANQMLIKLTTRKKRKWVRKWIERREQYGASNTLLKELAAEEPGDYRNILRITEAKFVELLEMISPAIRKQDTRMRTAINCKTKLEITLNYIGSGSSLKQLSYLFRVPHNTISTFLPQVLKAIYEALTGFIQVG